MPHPHRMKSNGKNAEPQVSGPKKSVLVVDDHPLFRKGVVQLLNDEPDLEVRAEAANNNQALGAIRKHKLDLAVVDIGLEGSTNGIELTKNIRAEKPKLPVLVLSMHDETLFAERALRAGARGRWPRCLVKFDQPRPATAATSQILLRYGRTPFVSLRSPSSRRVLIVPSGVFVFAAISRWLSPAKNESSIASR